jgi:hypothetical protein
MWGLDWGTTIWGGATVPLMGPVVCKKSAEPIHAQLQAFRRVLER